MNPVLTTLCQPMERMGDEAVKLVVDIIKGKNNHKHVVLPTELREGESLR
jgi:LacI family transcriptional regulator